MKKHSFFMKLAMVIALLAIASMGTGCVKPFNKPVWEEIGPSETAFMIPMTGDTASQAKLESESFLAKNQIAAKRVRIPMIEQKVGRFYWQIKYVPGVMLLKVDRAPVTREWTENTAGTSAKNEGITAQSKDGIAYLVRVNSTCQIDADNAAKYLFRYRNKSLESVMDTEIRPMVEKYFVQKASTMTYDEALQNKIAMMSEVDSQVTKFFAARGVTITVLGLKGEFTPVNSDVANSYASVASAKQQEIAQRAINEKIRSEATAKRQAAEEAAKAAEAYKVVKQYEMRELELKNDAAWINKWDGTLPTTALGDKPFIYGGVK